MFAVDALNEGVAAALGAGRPPLKYYAARGSVVALHGAGTGAVAAVDTARAWRRGASWWRGHGADAEIVSLSPCWFPADAALCDEAVLLRDRAGRFALWAPHDGGAGALWALPLAPLARVVSSRCALCVWRGADGGERGVVSLLAVGGDGLAYALPLAATGCGPDDGVDVESCMRLRTSVSDACGVLFARQRLDAVLFAVIGPSSVAIVRLERGGPPEELGAVRLPRRDGQSAIAVDGRGAMWMDGAFLRLVLLAPDARYVSLRVPVAVAGRGASAAEAIAKKTAVRVGAAPGVRVAAVAACADEAAPVFVLETEAGAALWDASREAVVAAFSAPLPCGAVHVDSTLRVHVLSPTGLSLDENAAAAYAWVESDGAPRVAAALCGVAPCAPALAVDLFPLFDVVRPIAPVRSSVPPLFAQLLRSGGAAPPAEMPQTWPRMRALLDAVSRLPRDAAAVAAHYLLEAYQPERADAFAAGQGVSRALCDEARMLRLLDAGRVDDALALAAARPPALGVRRGVDVYGAFRPRLQAYAAACGRLPAPWESVLPSEIRGVAVRQESDASLSKSVQSLATAGIESPVRPASPLSPRPAGRPAAPAVPQSPTRPASAARHHPRAPSRLAEQVRIVDTPSPASAAASDGAAPSPAPSGGTEAIGAAHAAASRESLPGTRASSPLKGILSPGGRRASPRKTVSFDVSADAPGAEAREPRFFLGAGADSASPSGATSRRRRRDDPATGDVGVLPGAADAEQVSNVPQGGGSPSKPMAKSLSVSPARKSPKSAPSPTKARQSPRKQPLPDGGARPLDSAAERRSPSRRREISSKGDGAPGEASPADGVVEVDMSTGKVTGRSPSKLSSSKDEPRDSPSAVAEPGVRTSPRKAAQAGATAPAVQEGASTPRGKRRPADETPGRSAKRSAVAPEANAAAPAMRTGDTPATSPPDAVVPDESPEAAHYRTFRERVARARSPAARPPATPEKKPGDSFIEADVRTSPRRVVQRMRAAGRIPLPAMTPLPGSAEAPTANGAPEDAQILFMATPRNASTRGTPRSGRPRRALDGDSPPPGVTLRRGRPS